MCGFIFVVERGERVDAGRLSRAAALLQHRGPDASGQAFLELPARGDGPAMHIGVVHHRLAILDLDSRSSQPFRRAGMTLAYNGELYNFRALRAGLEQRGHRFETEGDTEVLLALMARDGPAGLRAANGMWAFALLDEAAAVLTAVRDRYGKKPLYYFQDGRRLVIASEIKPISAYLGAQPRFEPAAIETYLAHGWLFPDAGSRTHVAGIAQVPPASCARFDLVAWSMATSPAATVGQAMDALPARQTDLPEIIESAVRDRLVSDRKVGLLLSGGVDSSLVLSVLMKCGLQEQIHCFTGDAGKSDDAEYASQCLVKAGIRATSVRLDYGAASVARFLDVCRHQEKPFPLIGNVLAMPEMYREIAAHDVPVVLDGTGGDEIFGGYRDRTWPLALADALAAGDSDWIAGIAAATRDDPKTAAITEATLTTLRSDPAAGVLGPRVGFVAREGSDTSRYLRHDFSRARSSDPLAGYRGTFDAALLADATGGRLQEWLWQNDRNAMLASVENRSPLLDHRLAPFLATGRRSKLVGPWNKHELRRIFDAFVPLPTQWRRQKQGFRWVYGRFLRNNRAEILAMIEATTSLGEHVRLGELLSKAAVDDTVLESELLQRATCLAGLEEAMRLAR